MFSQIERFYDKYSLTIFLFLGDLGIISKRLHSIDKPFDAFERKFELTEELHEHGDAKDFCKFLKDSDLLPRSNRQPEHITTLGQILKRWQGNGKSASWLIVQSIFWNDIPKKTQEAAKNLLFEALQSNEIDTYSKYRLLHHLVKRRGKNQKRDIWTSFHWTKKNDYGR